MARWVTLPAALVLGLPSMAAAMPSSTATGAVRGVTDDEILVVAIVPDFMLRRPLPPESVFPDALARQYQAYADAFGPVNGRRVVVKTVRLDLLDPTSARRVCAEAAQSEPLVVLHAPGQGYPASAVRCIAKEHDTPFFYGDQVTADVLRASARNLVTLAPSREALVQTVADLAKRRRLIDSSAQIGILSTDDRVVSEGVDDLVRALERRGFDVVSTIALNTAQNNGEVVEGEARDATSAMLAAGVDTVFLSSNFWVTQGFSAEVERHGTAVATFALDGILADSGQGDPCSTSGAPRVPPGLGAVSCVTTWDTRALPTGDAIKPDSAFEARCREAFDDFTGEQSQPGVPTVGLRSANGTRYVGDFPANQCTMMELLMDAVDRAGKHPTWRKVHRDLMQGAKSPAAYMSDGRGRFARGKPYLADRVHVVALRRVTPNSPPDTHGLFEGCPAPTSCWVPQLLDGKEWFPISR